MTTAIMKHAHRICFSAQGTLGPTAVTTGQPIDSRLSLRR